MNNYEITFIISPDMAEFEAQKIEAKIHGSVTKKGGSIISNNFWGKHEFAYSLRGHDLGYYATAVISLPPEDVNELTSEIRLMPEILRHLLISLNKEKIRVEDLKKMDLFREQPTPVGRPTTRRAPVAIRPSAPVAAPVRPKKDEATRMKELEEKLEDILSEEKDET